MSNERYTGAERRADSVSGEALDRLQVALAEIVKGLIRVEVKQDVAAQEIVEVNKKIDRLEDKREMMELEINKNSRVVEGASKFWWLVVAAGVSVLTFVIGDVHK